MGESEVEMHAPTDRDKELKEITIRLYAARAARGVSVFDGSEPTEETDLTSLEQVA